MARPKSSEKQSAILQAAAELVAELGDSAPTARIARSAGIAEGTLFTYFRSKDVLFNALYANLLGKLNERLMEGFPRKANPKVRLHHAFTASAEWGTKTPVPRRALRLLAASERVKAETKAGAAEAFPEVDAAIRECIDAGAVRDLPPAYILALLAAMAETTGDFMARFPKEAAVYRESGFEAFWKAVAWE
jgi:AcrR family transcriptional regulator